MGESSITRGTEVSKITQAIEYNRQSRTGLHKKVLGPANSGLVFLANQLGFKYLFDGQKSELLRIWSDPIAWLGGMVVHIVKPNRSQLFCVLTALIPPFS